MTVDELVTQLKTLQIKGYGHLKIVRVKDTIEYVMVDDFFPEESLAVFLCTNIETE